MTELELLIDHHRYSHRQGPGSTEETLRALAITGCQDKQGLEVADIGCGTGASTFDLANALNGKITAIDLFPEFLEELEQRYASDNIQTRTASMEDLPFEKNSLDLIWSEGAIYNMGFENGVKTWKEFLKPGGWLAVSEITWITNRRHVDLEEFWKGEYAEIDTAAEKIRLLEKYGYSLGGYFHLSEKSWTENYYHPLEQMLPDFLRRHNNSAAAKSIAEEHQSEIEMYQRNKDYYSYGFYIARKDV